LRETKKSIGENRINLWRKAIFLFSKTNQEEGPFFTAGYKQYWCEGKSIEKKTPDIFGFSENYYSVCDISLSPNKGEEMEKYEVCTPSEYIMRVLAITGELKSSGYPFLITDKFNLNKYSKYNLIQINDTCSATIESVNDPKLEVSFSNWQGFLTIPPSFQLMAVPESSMEELKKPVATVLKSAALSKDWIQTEYFVEKLLGHLYESFSQSSRGKLRKSVESILRDLARSHLKGILFIDSKEKSIKVEIDPSNSKSRKSFSEKINEWLEIVPIEHYFYEVTNDEEDEIDDD